MVEEEERMTTKKEISEEEPKKISNTSCYKKRKPDRFPFFMSLNPKNNKHTLFIVAGIKLLLKNFR